MSWSWVGFKIYNESEWVRITIICMVKSQYTITTGFFISKQSGLVGRVLKELLWNRVGMSEGSKEKVPGVGMAANSQGVDLAVKN